MARFSLVHVNRETGHKALGIASLAAVCKKRGHDFSLIDTAKYHVGFKTTLSIGEDLLEYKALSNPERIPAQIPVSHDEFYHKVLSEVQRSNPDLIGISTLSDDYPLAVSIARLLKKEMDKPILIGGVHATIAYQEVMENECFDIICRGEGEEALTQLLDSFSKQGNFFSDLNINNLSFRTERAFVENPIGMMSDLDDLPFLDWSCFDDIQFYKPYYGKVYKYGDYELGRGCPNSCSYCIVNYLHDLYKGKGRRYRKKNNVRAISELKFLKDTYGIEFIKFWDETFLLPKIEEFREFAEMYSREVSLPFVIETTAESVTPEKAMLLKSMGCVSASIGLETANYELRKNILGKNTANEVYERAFKLLNDNGIRTVSFIMIGLPGEDKKILRENIEFIRKNNIDTPAVGFIYPYKGTVFREYCINNGLINIEEVKEWENTVQYINSTSLRSFIVNDDNYIKYLEHFKRYFLFYKEFPVWMHPLIDLLFNDTINKDNFLEVMNNIVYSKRFGQHN